MFILFIFGTGLLIFHFFHIFIFSHGASNDVFCIFVFNRNAFLLFRAYVIACLYLFPQGTDTHFFTVFLVWWLNCIVGYL